MEWGDVDVHTSLHHFSNIPHLDSVQFAAIEAWEEGYIIRDSAHPSRVTTP